MSINWLEPNDWVALAADTVHVWSTPLDGTSERLIELRGSLTAEERGRADRFIRDEVRRRFIVARAGLRSVLGRYLSMAPADVLIEIGAQGKPFLGAIAARTDLQFNLAHSGELALVAVTRGCPVGVDVERLRPIEHWTEIASRYFHPAEVAAIAASIEGERNTGFLRCWTQKEAILKAFGVGLGHSLQSFAVPVLEQSGQWVELDALAGATPRRYWLRSLVPSAGYVAAVATSVERKMMAGLVGEF